MLHPIHAINLNLLQVKGRSDLFLNLEVMKKLITTIILFITVPIGIEAICFGIMTQSYISVFINTYYTSKLSNISTLKQFKNIFPIWLLVVILFCIIHVFNITYQNNDYYTLVLSLLSFILCYFLVVYYFYKDIYNSFYNALF